MGFLLPRFWWLKRRCGGWAAPLTLLALLGAAPLPAPLYSGQAMVTGTDNRDRPRGLAQCLDEVLVKVSGDPNIVDKPGLPALRRQAARLLRGIDYHDRMTGLPHHDEQGSRDRPFVLTADFDPAKIGQVLAGLGEAPWTGQRPAVWLLVQVHGYSGNFTVTQAEPAAALMRDAMQDAAVRYGLQVTLPVGATPATPAGGMLVLGKLDWSDAAYGWIATWQTDWKGKHFAWSERGVSFDVAFRSAMAGALGAASGHGVPLH